MFPGVRDQRALLVVEFGVEVTQREHHEVGEQRPGTTLQPHPLAPLARSAHPQGAPGVPVDADARRQGGDRLLVHPGQVRALELPVGEGAPAHGRPLVQAGSGAHRSGHVHRVVGEHGDVLGLGVHPQQRRLGLPPDAATARRIRVHQVHVEFGTGVQFGDVGGDPLQDTGPPRPGADDDERGHHFPRSGYDGAGRGHARAP